MSRVRSARVQPQEPFRQSLFGQPLFGWRRALPRLALAAVAGVAILAGRSLLDPTPPGPASEAAGACDPSLACAVPSAALERASPRPILPMTDPRRAVEALLTAVRQVEVAEAGGALLDPAEPAALRALVRAAGPLALSADPLATWPRKGADRPEAIPLGALITSGAGDVSYGEKPEPVLASAAPAVASAQLP